MAARQSSAKIFISSAQSSQWTASTSNTRIKVPVAPFILPNNSTEHFVIGIESLSIPIAFQAVGSSNNTIEIGGVSSTITSGNYTISNLIIALNAAAASVGYVWAYNSSTNTVTLTRTAGGTIVIGAATTMITILGISIGTIAAAASPPTTYSPTSLVNLTTTSGIIVRILNIANDNRDNLSTGGGSTALGRIPINCAPYRILQFYNSSPFYTTISNRTITELEIQLCDDSFQQLNLIGNPNWFLTLRIDYAEIKSSLTDRTLIQKGRDNLVPEAIKPKLTP